MKTKKIATLNLILLLLLLFAVLQTNGNNFFAGYNHVLFNSYKNKNNYLTSFSKSFAPINDISAVSLNKNKSQKHSSVKASSAIFARIKANNTHLYKTAHHNESLENKWCLLAQTFFVKVLDNFNDSFYKVEYNGLFGYVKKESVNLVNETPTNPYPPETLITIKSTTGAHLRATPKKDSSLTNTLTTISAGTSNLQYIGKIFGEEGVDTQGKIWYLVGYDKTVGYIHSYFASTYVAETVNSEHATLKLSVEDSNLNPLTNYQNGFLILLAMLPLVVILALLYKQPKTKLPKTNIKTQTKASQKTTVEINDFTEPEI